MKFGKKKYSDYRINKGTIEVKDLSFLSDRNHHYGWFRRHYRHHRLRLGLKKAKNIVAENPNIAIDLVRYYFVPKNNITIKNK